MTKPNPIAVVISDIHYNIQTLPVADAAMRLAIAKANELDVMLIVAGDLHDTKAHMRGECVEAMINRFSLLKNGCLILRGNHDSINERSTKHSLEFLSAMKAAFVIDEGTLKCLGLNFIPYMHDADELRALLQLIPKGSTVIMHQGLKSSNPGDYIQDKSAITPEDVAGLRVISGHYHTRQTIDLPDGGKWDYIGNPYSLNFAEANDPEKGFQILMSDGSLEFVPTNLRKHVIVEILVLGNSTQLLRQHRGELTWFYDPKLPPISPADIIKVSVKTSIEKAAFITKDWAKGILSLSCDFRLDLIPDEVEATATEEQVSQLSQPDLLDSMIDSIDADTFQKSRLKTLWKDLK